MSDFDRVSPDGQLSMPSDLVVGDRQIIMTSHRADATHGSISTTLYQGRVPSKQTAIQASAETAANASKMVVSGFSGTISATIVSTALSGNSKKPVSLEAAATVGSIGLLFTAISLILSMTGGASKHPEMTRAAMIFQVFSLVCASGATMCLAVAELSRAAAAIVVWAGLVAMAVVVRYIVVFEFKQT